MSYTPSSTNSILTSGLANVLKEKYMEKIYDIIPQEIMLWNLFKEKVAEEAHSGEYRVRITMQTMLNESATAIAETDALPAARVPAYDYAYLYIKKVVGRMVLTGDSLDLTKGKNSLIDTLNRNVESTIKPFLMNINSWLHLNGDGVLCQSTGAAVDHTTYYTITVDSTRFLRPGMVLDGYDASNNHDADGIVVTSVNHSSNTFDCTGVATSVDANTKFYIEGSWVTSGSLTISGSHVPQGLSAIVDDTDPTYGDFQGLDRATKTYAQSYVLRGTTPGTPEAITIYDIINVLDKIDGYTALKPDMIYTNQNVRNCLYELYRVRNIPTETMPAKDGLPMGLKFHYSGTDIPIVDNRMAEPYAMYFLNRSKLFRYVAGKFKWEDRGGWLRPLEDYDAFQAVYKGYINFGTVLPQAHGKIEDVSETIASYSGS